MNTASRHESTGEPGRIQISRDTADLLADAGKSDWFKPRADLVHMKGKGDVATFWLKVSRPKGARKRAKANADDFDDRSYYDEDDYSDSEGSYDFETEELVQSMVSPKVSRLIEWNTEVLIRLLKQIILYRQANGIQPEKISHQRMKKITSPPKGCDPVDEVKEVIDFIPLGSDVVINEEDIHSLVLDRSVVDQLHDFVTNIAIMYRDECPFHNFEHASHVAMCVGKLLARIVENTKSLNASGHGSEAFRMNCDPLVQFACVFSALIHDIDHQGVPNAQLVSEGAEIARHYKGKSVAEQNSLDLAWGLLCDENYEDLRNTLCTTEGEWRRFRQLVVNSVMATDVMDRDLRLQRDARWAKAFSATASNESQKEMNDRRATIVIEHIIQASDVSHTMQHWEVFNKWNERLFMEMYKAHHEGRAKESPDNFWYEGELGFFDFYIMNLAQKLKECRVFGVSSDEFLDFAIRNRKEWEAKGREIVERRLLTCMRLYSNGESAAATEAVGNETLTVGQNKVTTTSVTSALSSLMQQVQMMQQMEQQLSGSPK